MKDSAVHVQTVLLVFILLSLIFCSVIGTPAQTDWPTNVSLPRSSFQRFAPFSLAELIPEMCKDGILLLKVKVHTKCALVTAVLM